MYLKNRINATILFLVCAACLLNGCTNQRKQLEESLNQSLGNFYNVISDRNLRDMELYVYYMGEKVLICRTYGVDDLIRDVEAGGYQGQKVYVGNEDLKNNIDLLREINGHKFIPIPDSNCYKRISSCFIFRSDKEGVVLEIALGGYSYDVEGEIMYVNGFPVEYNEIYSKLINTFCPNYNLLWQGADLCL